MTVAVTAIVAIATVLILVSLGWLASHLLVRRWRAQFTEQIGRASVRIARLDRELSRLERAAELYSPDDPAPYGPIAQALRAALGAARDAYGRSLRQRSGLLQRAPASPGSDPHGLWYNSLAQLSAWRRLCREARALEASTAEAGPHIARARGLLEELRDKPAAAARRWQDLRQLATECAQLERALRDAGLYGTTLDEAAREVTELSDRLETVPDWCAEGAEVVAQQRPSMESTALAWSVLDDAEQAIRRRQKALERWQTTHSDLGPALEAMRRTVDLAERRLGEVPDSVDVGEETERAKRLVAEAADLEAQYTAPTVEVLAPMVERTRQADDAAIELIELVDKVEALLERLAELIPGNRRMLNALEVTMGSLASAESYPVDWGQHGATVGQLRQAGVQVGALTAERTPELLGEHVARAERVAADGQELERVVGETEALWKALVPLLAGSALAGRAWVAQVETLHAQANRYGPANWASELGVGNLQADASKLAARHRQWVPASSRTPIPAAGMDRRLEEVRKLAAALGPFQRRLQGISERLAVVQRVEGETRGMLGAVGGSLDNLLGAVEQSRDRLQRRVGAVDPALARPSMGRVRQLERVRQEGRRLTAELDRERVGGVEEIQGRTTQWVGSCRKSLQAVLRSFHEERGETVDLLRGEIEALQEVAPFSAEPAMREAMQLLEVERYYRLPRALRESGDGPDPFGSRVSHASRLLGDRERLLVCLDSVRLQVGARIEDARQRMNSAQRDAQRGLDELEAYRERTARGRAPLLCDTEEAQHYLGRAQRAARELQRSGYTVSQVLTALQGITRDCERVIGAAQECEQASRRERQDLEGVLDRVARFREQLEAYRRRHGEEPDVVDAVEERIREIDGELGRVRRRHGRSPPPYREARRDLEHVWSVAHDRDLPVRGRGEPVRIRDVEAGR